MFDCNNINVLNKIVYIVFFVAIIVVLVFLILNIMKYKKEQIDKKDLYKKIIIKLLAVIILLIVPALFERIIVNPYNTSCEKEEKERQEKEKEKELEEKEREKREKEKLEKEKELQEKIDAINKEIDALEESLSQSDLDKIKNEMLEITDTNSQNIIYNRLLNFDEYVKINTTIESLKVKYNHAEYYNAYKAIEKISNEKIKAKLFTKISELGRGKPLNVSKQILSDTEYNIFYQVGIPEHPTENMPLIIFMQPYSCHMDLGKNSSRYTDEEFFFIAPDVGSSNDDLLRKFKLIIDSVVEEYKINKNKIIITGHSNGARSAMKLVSFYPDFFAAVVPTGAHPSLPKESIGITSFYGICGDGESCAETMREFVEITNYHGGNARCTIVHGDHDSSSCGFVRTEVLDWVFAQEKNK